MNEWQLDTTANLWTGKYRPLEAQEQALFGYLRDRLTNAFDEVVLPRSVEDLKQLGHRYNHHGAYLFMNAETGNVEYVGCTRTAHAPRAGIGPRLENQIGERDGSATYRINLALARFEDDHLKASKYIRHQTRVAVIFAASAEEAKFLEDQILVVFDPPYNRAKPPLPKARHIIAKAYHQWTGRTRKGL